MKSEILRLLRESDGYLSGQQLSERFGVSRAAVWKVICGLREEGYQVEAVRKKGYRIVESPDILSKEELESLMQTQWAGRKILYYDETESTNRIIRRAADDGAPHGTLAVADRQTGGKGRRGRTWDSPAGCSIYMSVLLRPKIRPERASMLTLVMAVSTAEGIRDCLSAGEGEKIRIKWPNDIIVNGRKLAGILTEMNAQIDYIDHVTVGVGINVNTGSFPDELKHAASMKTEFGRTFRRSVLIAAVMKRLEENYESFIGAGDLSPLMERYRSMLINLDRDVLVIRPSGQYRGHAVGIEPTGELLVRKEDGTVEKVYAGDVSVRGVYGYV